MSEVVRVPLTRGLFALIDAEDADMVFCHKWQAIVRKYTAYVATDLSRRTGKRGKILLHRLVMHAPDGVRIDHINGDGLDNRKANLRFATSSQNLMNARPRSDGNSRFKGVAWIQFWRRRKGSGAWRVTLKKDGKQFHVGYFKDEIEAARAYDAKARELYGEYAHVNFPLLEAEGL